MRSFCHSLHGDVMAGEGFFSHLLKVPNAFFCGWDVSLRESIGDSPGFKTHHQIEGGCIARIVFLLVMDEFCHREVVSPFCWFVSAVDPEVGFKFLIQTFCLAVCLGMVGG